MAKTSSVVMETAGTSRSTKRKGYELALTLSSLFRPRSTSRYGAGMAFLSAVWSDVPPSRFKAELTRSTWAPLVGISNQLAELRGARQTNQPAS